MQKLPQTIISFFILIFGMGLPFFNLWAQENINTPEENTLEYSAQENADDIPEESIENQGQANTIGGSFESEYLKGTVVDVQENEEGFRDYIVRLKNGDLIYLDSYGERLERGTSVFIEHLPDQDVYNFVTVNRSTQIFIILGIFIAAIVLLTKKQAFRSLGSLFLSMLLLFLVLVPLLLKGYPPVLIATLFGFCVLSLSIFITHGFNKQSLVSFLGSFFSIIVAVVILEAVVQNTLLTGIINEEIQLLSFDIPGLRLVGIISASIVIGILGVLDDITITQVAVVRELSSDHSLSKKEIFLKALNVGKDHISALVNTLVFAYVGAVLPMMMFVSLLEIPFYVLVSQEFIFIEIIRSLVGAIALALAVPVTTWLAVYVFLEAIHKDSCTVESTCAKYHKH